MVAKVLARVPLVRRRKEGLHALKVKTKWTNQESIFSSVGEDGQNKPLGINCEHKKALGIKPGDFHLKGYKLEIGLKIYYRITNLTMSSLHSSAHPDLHVGSKEMKETGRKIFLN